MKGLLNYNKRRDETAISETQQRYGSFCYSIAINLWNKNHTKKRYAGMEKLLSELEDCIPSSQTVECEIEEKELSEHISAWLRSLDKENRE